MILPALLAEVAAVLGPLELNYAFVGGSIVEFLVDHRGLSPVRPTDDLDIIVEVVTQRHYAEVERKLRAAGFEHDTSPGAPICRWLYRGVIVDIMPTTGDLIGLNTQWFVEALSSVQLTVINGVPLRLISPVVFVATKLAAFADRGRCDYYGSHDLEDIVAVIDGRAHIVEELATAETSLRNFVVAGVARLMDSADFQESLPGHLPFDEASQRRLPGLRKKLQAIAATEKKP